MGSLSIIKTSPMLSIQDMGREGYAAYAVPHGGVMDRNSASIAHAILGQPSHLPILEITLIAPKIQFHSASVICLTGADFDWKINNNPISLTAGIHVAAGDVLTGGSAKRGSRGYLAVEGHIQAHLHMNSVATYPLAGLGGLNGQYLSKGDQIEWSPVDTSKSTKRLRRTKLKSVFPFHPGPEFDYLLSGSKATLISKTYKIGQDADRMGLRLQGQPLTSDPMKLMKSVPVVPGMIQLPPNGLPIILLRDCQTTGGYPRIGYIPQDEHNALGQLCVGDCIQFQMME